MRISADDILAVTKSVTKEGTKQRKAEEPGSRSHDSPSYIYSDRVYFSQVADKILPAAYAHASGDGQYSVSKRQLFTPAAKRSRKKRTGSWSMATLLGRCSFSI